MADAPIIAAPVIDGRGRAAIVADLLAHAPGYVPEWQAAAGSPGYALLAILARDIEIQAAAENGMPDRARLAFLSTLGDSLLSAQPAATPLVFQLMPNAPLDVTLAQGSQVAAVLPPPPPSLLSTAATTTTAPIFSTDETITLTRAQLTTVYSVSPDDDTYADHSALLKSGFSFFDNMQQVPHQLYLGHDEMFRLPGSAQLQLSFDLGPAFSKSTARPLLLDWEYLSQDGWLPLRVGADQTAGLTQDGRITLLLDFGPDAKQDTVAGVSSYWIRASVSARTPTGRIGPLPGGYAITWGPSAALANVPPNAPQVTVDGTASAFVTAVAQSTLTLSRSLPGAKAGVLLRTFPGGAPLGRIAKLAGGQSLVLVGVDPGRTVTIDGSSTATVLDASGDVAMLDQPLTGSAVAKGATLQDASTGDTLGTLLGFDTDFSVPLDSTSDFLADNVVTVDGNTKATITMLQAASVALSGPIDNATLGNALVLANPLPPLRPEGATASGVLPSVDTIFARVGFTKSGLAPDLAFCDTAPLDTSNAFYPFGKSPQKFTTFYIASEEVFQRQNAQVTIRFLMAQAGEGFSDADQPGVGSGLLEWSVEYYNGSMWVAMGPAQSLDDETKCLTAGDRVHWTTIGFICPDDWTAAEVNGQSKHWLRFRIDSGNYGHPLRLKVDTSQTPPTVTSEDATLTPPVVASINLQYTFLTNAGLVEHCLTYNDFVFADHSQDVRWPRSTFQPFTPVGDAEPAVHFGFSQQLPAGLVSLYFAAAAQDPGSAPTSSPFVWEYLSARGWVELSVLDGTDGFSSNGLLQCIGPPDAAAAPGLGGTLYWVRARLKPDIDTTPLPGSGLWLNAVEAHQGQTVQNDTLGNSDGNPGQTFAFAPQHVPVLPNEVIKVREWTGRGDDWQTAVAGVLEADIQRDIDPSDGKTGIGFWVTWHAQPFFYLSGPNDRHYVLERATGLLQFPTPPYGMIPPAGATITASYATGGGLDGNVPAGTITELHSAASYVQSVTNPFPATGGSATEIVTRARDRSTQRIRHRSRAVAPADFEWIACEASPEVARVRCLTTTGPDGDGQLGWVTLVVVPNSTDAAPMPSEGLLADVQTELRAAVPAAIVGNILLSGPNYTALSVRAEIVPLDAEDAAMVEARLRDALTTFLHPLTGGVNGTGWDFGQPVYLSQIATLLEAVEGVDYVSLLQLLVDDGVVGDFATIGPNALVTQGDHQLKLLAQQVDAGAV
jgi:hypothetical protein